MENGEKLEKNNGILSNALIFQELDLQHGINCSSLLKIETRTIP